MVTSTTSLTRQAADPESALSNHKKDVEEDSRGSCTWKTIRQTANSMSCAYDPTHFKSFHSSQILNQYQSNMPKCNYIFNSKLFNLILFEVNITPRTPL